jgi:DNA-directed RNA polymerase subunit RPC12/RpoP
MPEIKLPVVKCLKCGAEWTPRKVPVRQCPKCQTRRFDEPKPDKKEKE